LVNTLPFQRLPSTEYEDGKCSPADRTIDAAHVVNNVVVSFVGYGNDNETELTVGTTTYINRADCVSRGVGTELDFVSVDQHCISGDFSDAGGVSPAVPIGFGPPLGAPLFLYDSDSPMEPAIGIFDCRSPDSNDCVVGGPVADTLVYTRLGTYANWIGETIRNCAHFAKTLGRLKRFRKQRELHGRHGWQNGHGNKNGQENGQEKNGNGEGYPYTDNVLNVDNTQPPIFDINGSWKPVSNSWHQTSHKEHSFSHDQVKRAFEAGMFEDKKQRQN